MPAPGLDMEDQAQVPVVLATLSLQKFQAGFDPGIVSKDFKPLQGVGTFDNLGKIKVWLSLLSLICFVRDYESVTWVKF